MARNAVLMRFFLSEAVPFMTNEVKVVLKPRVGDWVQIDAIRLTGSTFPKGKMRSNIFVFTVKHGYYEFQGTSRFSSL